VGLAAQTRLTPLAAHGLTADVAWAGDISSRVGDAGNRCPAFVGRDSNTHATLGHGHHPAVDGVVPV
jgi:hypothetical protein